MSPTEMVWRAGQLTLGVAAPLTEPRVSRSQLPDLDDEVTWTRWWESFRLAQDRPLLLDRARAERIARERPDEVARLIAAAEQVVAGRMRFLGYAEASVGRPVDWNHDPLSGHDWPRENARRIDHRTAAADPKWIWELNRLQHLPWLAQAWLFTGRDEFAECAFEHLDSWLEQNPVGVGIAWRGAFEAGIRAISVLVALQGLRTSSALTLPRFRRLVVMLEASGRACWRERSRFSSANNHLVGELAGLATIGLLLPELPRSRRWVERAVEGLAEQADLQIHPDGSGAEQAAGYQMFTTELLLTVLVLTTSASGYGDPRLHACLTRSSAFLAAVVGPRDPDPRHGDDDGGFAVRLGPEEVRTVRDHLALVGAYGAAVPGSGLPAAWVAQATAGADPLVTGDERPPTSIYAPDGGLAVVRAAGDRVTVDVGPLGYLALAAHGHADALAVTLAVDGVPVIDDPGTASYYGHPAWREAHRSTPAHATVTVDGQDQSVMAGPFLWSRHARVRVHEVDLSRGVVDAEHDGYTRLEAPVTHRRRVEMPSDGGVVVIDVMHGEGEHRFDLSWPLAPGLTSSVVSSGHLVSRQGRPLVQMATSGTLPLTHSHVVGDEASNLGWWSDRLERRTPAYLLRTTATGAVPLVLATIVRQVRPAADLPISDLRVEVVGQVAMVSWHEEGRLLRESLTVSVRAGAQSH